MCPRSVFLWEGTSFRFGRRSGGRQRGLSTHSCTGARYLGGRDWVGFLSPWIQWIHVACSEEWRGVWISMKVILNANSDSVWSEVFKAASTQFLLRSSFNLLGHSHWTVCVWRMHQQSGICCGCSGGSNSFASCWRAESPFTEPLGRVACTGPTRRGMGAQKFVVIGWHSVEISDWWYVRICQEELGRVRKCNYYINYL